MPKKLTGHFYWGHKKNPPRETIIIMFHHLWKKFGPLPLSLAMAICFVLFTIINPMSAHAIELAIVQAVSVGGESFVTRNGTDYGILEGQEMTFLTDDLSLVCRAEKVSRNFAHWRPIDPKARVPFEREQVITMERSSEKIWSMFNPDEIKSEGVRYPFALIGRFHYGKGLSQSVSGVDNVDVDRTANEYEVVWRWKFSKYLSWAMGARYEQELTQTEVADVFSTRYFLLNELTYHFGRPDVLSTLDPYFGATLGIGRSTSTVINDTQSGMAYVMPRLRLGVELQPWNEYGIQVEGALEALNASESFNTSGAQVTNQISWSVGLGFISLYR